MATPLSPRERRQFHLADCDDPYWTVAKLKDELRKYKLKVSGNKPELCKRLAEYFQIEKRKFPNHQKQRLNRHHPQEVHREVLLLLH